MYIRVNSVEHFVNNNLKEKPLEDPIFLNQKLVSNVFESFGYEFDYDKHVRDHIGMLLETPRYLLQYVGTDILHRVNPNVHVDSLVDQLSDEGINIITDMRFVHEFDHFTDNFQGKFFPVYVKNNKAELIASGDMHKSEKDLQKFKHKCIVIENNSSLEDYEKKIIDFVGGIL
jgi:hypothetical protein